MVTELTVSADAGGDGEGDGGVVPGIPESARVIGIVTVAVMVAIIGLAYFFLRYGGDDGLESEEEGCGRLRRHRVGVIDYFRVLSPYYPRHVRIGDFRPTGRTVPIDIARQPSGKPL